MPSTMQAMVLDRPGRALAMRRLPVPVPGAGEVLLRIEACAVCRTDLHIVDGELADPALPLVPGHEAVGRVVAVGAGSAVAAPGSLVGVPWLGGVCGTCRYCRRGDENLCNAPVFTGYTRDGGFAEFMVADARFVLPLPAGYDAVSAAPLLCAGLIGYRAYRMAGSGKRIGLYGFGAAAHILTQLAAGEGRSVYAFTRPGDERSQKFATSLGAVWAGDTDGSPPDVLDAAILFAPVGELVPAALRAVDKGGTVVCAGIHMSDIPSFPYRDLWEERVIRSVANLTREDGRLFLETAARARLQTHTHRYPLDRANQALEDLRHGRIDGAAVLSCMDGGTPS